METFSDLEQNIEFQPDLNFGKDDFCVVTFILDGKQVFSCVKLHQMLLKVESKKKIN